MDLPRELGTMDEYLLTDPGTIAPLDDTYHGSFQYRTRAQRPPLE